MTRILLTGKSGQVGWELRRTLAALGEVIALDRQGMDLANPDSIRRAVRDCKPNLLVNAAAYTAVDKAEEEPDLAMAINGVAPGIMAEEAKRLGAAMIHLSTDYVFDGTKAAPYEETDLPNPLNVYGRTKLAGERAIQGSAVPHLILRTSWVYGTRGNNFLMTILKLAKERDHLSIVDDQIGAPTWSRSIAEAITSASSNSHRLRPGRESVYNLTASGETSWHGFAKAILGHVHSKVRLNAISSAEYRTAAVRPHNSRLSNDRLHREFGLTMPHWQSVLALCLEEIAA